MADLSEQLRELLADPAAMEKISSIAGTLSSGCIPTVSSAPAAESTPVAQPAVRSVAPQKKDPRAELLRALKPFVSPEKRGQLDEILRWMTIADLVLPLLRAKGGKGLV